MKKISFLLLLTTAVVAIFPACKNSGTSGLIVPKDAAVVVHISGSSILSKLSWEDIKQSPLFKAAYDSTKDDYKRKLLDNPETSGVDLKGDFVMFTKRHGSQNYTTFQGKIKDAAAFETLNKQASEGVQVQKNGELNFVRHDSTSIITWNKNSFFLVSQEMAMNNMPDFTDTANLFSDTSDVYNFQDLDRRTVSTDTLLQFIQHVLALKGDDLLEDDERFSDLVKEKGDMHLWVNSEQSFAGLPDNALSMMKIGNLMKGNISASTVNFDNGKVTMASKQYMNKDLQEIFEANKPEPVTADLINRIPSQNVTAVFAMNMPTEGLRAFLKVSGMDGLANMMLANYNMNVDEITNAYKGAMILSLSDLAMKEENVTMEGSDFSYKSSKPGAQFFMAMAVNNRASFEKLWNIAQKELLKDTSKNKNLTHNLSNEWFAISNTPEGVSQFMSGTKNNFDFTSRISGHPFGAYIDLRKLVPFAKSMTTGAQGAAAVDSTWENVVMTGGEMVKGAVVSNVEINLIDKNTNSLKQIFNYFSGMFRDMSPGEGDRQRQVITAPPADTTTVAPF